MLSEDFAPNTQTIESTFVIGKNHYNYFWVKTTITILMFNTKELIHEKNIFLVSCDAHRLCDSNGTERKHLR